MQLKEKHVISQKDDLVAYFLDKKVLDILKMVSLLDHTHFCIIKTTAGKPQLWLKWSKEKELKTLCNLYNFT